MTKLSKEYMMDMRKRKFLKGICSTCPNKKEPERMLKSQCFKCVQRCVEINRKTRLKRIKDKVCVRCGKDEVVNINSAIKVGRVNIEQMCYKCYLTKMSRQYLGTNKRWKELEDIFLKQKGKCVLTGLPLTIGKDAHLDHIIPCFSKKHKDRLTTIDNLQWVNMDINFMKRALSVNKFIELCKLVAKRAV